MHHFLRLASIALAGLIGLNTASGQTALSYQGRLNLSNVPLNGSCDVQVSLWTAVSGGTLLAGPITISNVTVTKGLFSIAPDFGQVPWDGDPRFLQIAVRAPAGSGTYTTLTPRQAVSPVPYALRAEDSGEWNETGNDIWRENGNVGIGSPNPVARLQVVALNAGLPTATFDQPSGTNYIEFFSHLAPNPNLTSTALQFLNNGNVVGRILASTTGDIHFATGSSNTIRMSIGSSGTVGIGSPALPDVQLALDSSPGYGLYMVGTGKIRAANALEFTTMAGDILLAPSGGNTLQLNPYGSGVTWIGAGGGSGDLVVNGQIGVGMGVDSAWGISSLLSCQKLAGGNSWNVPSDRRAKEDIHPIEGALDRLARLRPVSFHWQPWYLDQVPSAGTELQYNFIAQEFEEVFPGSCTPTSIATPDGGSLLTLNTSALTPYTIAAIQELTQHNAQLKETLRSQEERIHRLEAALEKLLKEDK